MDIPERCPLNEVVLLAVRDGIRTVRPQVCSFVTDSEGDCFRADFCPDGYATFYPDKLKYMIFSAMDLERIAAMTDEARETWESLAKYWDDKAERWIGWEYLAADTILKADWEPLWPNHSAEIISFSAPYQNERDEDDEPDESG